MLQQMHRGGFRPDQGAIGRAEVKRRSGGRAVTEAVLSGDVTVNHRQM